MGGFLDFVLTSDDPDFRLSITTSAWLEFGSIFELQAVESSIVVTGF